MIRSNVLMLFCLSLAFAAYLGFASLHLGHDKAIHFVTFFILTLEFYFLWKTHRPWKRTLVVMTLGASISSEYVQHFINPNRVFDYMDIVYNMHGSGLAVVVCCVIHTYLIRRRPHGRDFIPISGNEEMSDIEGFVNIKMSDVNG